MPQTLVTVPCLEGKVVLGTERFLEKEGLVWSLKGKGSTKIIPMSLSLQVTLVFSPWQICGTVGVRRLVAELLQGVLAAPAASISERRGRERCTDEAPHCSYLQELENTAAHRSAWHKITHSLLEWNRNRLWGRDPGCASSITSVPVVHKLMLQKCGRGSKRAQHGKRTFFWCGCLLSWPPCSTISLRARGFYLLFSFTCISLSLYSFLGSSLLFRGPNVRPCLGPSWELCSHPLLNAEHSTWGDVRCPEMLSLTLQCSKMTDSPQPGHSPQLSTLLISQQIWMLPTWVVPKHCRFLLHCPNSMRNISYMFSSASTCLDSIATMCVGGRNCIIIMSNSEKTQLLFLWKIILISEPMPSKMSKQNPRRSQQLSSLVYSTMYFGLNYYIVQVF